MKFTSQQAELPGFQMTPIIDVVFLLLCFFVTTAVFSQWEYEVDIQLPSAESGVTPERLPGEIIINLNKDGEISVNQYPLTADELLEKCRRLVAEWPGHPVVIRSDKKTEWAHVLGVLDVCKNADIWNISFATAMVDGDGGDALPEAKVQ